MNHYTNVTHLPRSLPESETNELGKALKKWVTFLLANQYIKSLPTTSGSLSLEERSIDSISAVYMPRISNGSVVIRMNIESDELLVLPYQAAIYFCENMTIFSKPHSIDELKSFDWFSIKFEHVERCS